MARILVIDDEEMILFAFEQFLKDEGHTPCTASNAEEAMANLRDASYDVIFLDYRLPGMDGLKLLREIRRACGTPVVFMTAYGAMDVAIQAMQLGAYEYLTKPLDLDTIRKIIAQILERKENTDIRELAGSDEASPDEIVGESASMHEIFKMIGLLTTQDVTVLITGESGVGKELVARAIHGNSPRRQEPFVAVNCGAMPETLLEAEMFGYEKGAFTGADAQKPGKFEAAGNGTIFLDEIGDLQMPLQVKLLRVLQERAFSRIGGNRPVRTNARVLAATNKDLAREMGEGRFRKDLFYRLHLIQVHIPPLRERPGDIPILVSHFIRKANREMNQSVRGVTNGALERMVEYPWPGNARELENMIKRAMVLSREDVLHEGQFSFPPVQVLEGGSSFEREISALVSSHVEKVLGNPGEQELLFEETMAIVEKAMIRAALERTKGNQASAARLIGLHRTTLRKKIQDYGL